MTLAVFHEFPLMIKDEKSEGLSRDPGLTCVKITRQKGNKLIFILNKDC
uniref:Uncharacterized protein n=1 Tax=Lepeophtheirus salmonis TaxID=72036 RepID=A0A0K2TZ60_LEPSM